MNFLSLVLASAERVPAKPALVVGATSLSYEALVEGAARVAAGLQRAGVGRDDAVGLYLHDRREWVETFLAVSFAGARPVPINFRYGRREVAHITRDARLRALVYEPGLASALDEEMLRALIPVCVGDGPGIAYSTLAAESAEPRDTDAGPRDVHCILYTSGTTGLPKGALCTHANTVIGHLTAAAHWGLQERDVFLVASPLCHRVALSRLLNSLALGATIEVLPRFDADEVLRRLAATPVTVLSMVPTMARLLVAGAGSRRFPDVALRLVLLTGEALPESTRAAIMRVFPRARCFSFFASTECGIMSVLDSEHQLAHARSVGRPVAGVRVRLADERGGWAGPGAVGEICIRSGAPGAGTVFAGYVGAGGESFLDGWFRTGDMGRFDDDGFLHVVDRRKDMVISGGLNIASKEVEEVLLTHPAVREAAVVGVPDETYGEAVVAFVVPRAPGAVSADDLVAHCRAHMAGYKKPRAVVFVDELPRTPAGKVLKTELRRVAAQRTGAPEALP